MTEQPLQSTSSANAIPLDFQVVGYSKCGTTTLCSLLAEHPDIFMPASKEYRFFDLEHPQHRRDRYEARFWGIGAESCVGDGSVWYTDAEFEVRARRNLLSAHPDLRFIFIARDPLARVESAFRESHHDQGQFDQDCPFELAEAIQSVPGIWRDSRYGERLDNYRLHVPPERLLLLALEELNADPAGVLARCFDFLGVATDVSIERAERQLNAGAEKYRDTPLMRELRGEPAMASALGRIPFETQQQFLPQLGLREPFPAGELAWDARAQASFIAQIGDDPLRYLDAAGLPVSLWPRFKSLLETHS